MKKEELAVTDVEETDPRDIHLVNIYICKTCKSVWAGPAKFCPFCGLKVQNITKLEENQSDLSIQSGD